MPEAVHAGNGWLGGRAGALAVGLVLLYPLMQAPSGGDLGAVLLLAALLGLAISLGVLALVVGAVLNIVARRRRATAG